MGSVAKFAAINTKVRALKRNMLDLSDYKNLIEKNNVNEVGGYLKNKTGYKKALKDLDIERIHRDDIEINLKKYMVKQYEKLLHFFIGEYRKLFLILFKKFEIEDLKLYLRTISRGEDPGSIKDLILYDGRYSNIDHEKLLQSDSMEDFVNNLKGSSYYDILHPYLDEEEDRLMFYFEMNLDRMYFSELYEQVENLKKSDRKAIEDVLSINIDLLNIEWLYRGGKFFHLSSEELVNYALKGGNRIDYDLIKKLSYAENEDEFIDLISHTPYIFLFRDRKNIDLYMEIRLESYLYNRFLDYFHEGSMDLIVSVSYVHLLEYEIRDIISISEGIRYGLSKKDIIKYIIREIDKEVK